MTLNPHDSWVLLPLLLSIYLYIDSIEELE